MDNKLKPRNAPIQQRALVRRDKILRATLELLNEVGVDDLTTILVAKRVGISVGTLYHYFPNKHAIMYALLEQWLVDVAETINGLQAEDIESLRVKPFVDLCTERFLLLYQRHKGLLPLVSIFEAIPELKTLNSKYRDLVIEGLTDLLRRLAISSDSTELERLASLYMQINHGLLLAIALQTVTNPESTLADLKYLNLCFLERAKGQF
jgi:AcrR family transcriptional regulator